MLRFVETVRITDGKPLNLSYHNQRMNATRAHFFPYSVPLSLGQPLSQLPATLGKVKCHIVYADTLMGITCSPYIRRPITSLRCVVANSVSYAYKWEDRSVLDALHGQRGLADEVLIVRNGLITDTSFSNVALYDGQQWFTPAHPLLKGTKRGSLIDAGQLAECEIRVIDLPHFQSISLINAMLDLGDTVIDISQVF
jgi:4-amino-4-deoxychorismate lyase